jgi:hypothetical protein
MWARPQAGESALEPWSVLLTEQLASARFHLLGGTVEQQVPEVARRDIPSAEATQEYRFEIDWDDEDALEAFKNVGKPQG